MYYKFKHFTCAFHVHLANFCEKLKYFQMKTKDELCAPHHVGHLIQCFKAAVLTGKCLRLINIDRFLSLYRLQH